MKYQILKEKLKGFESTYSEDSPLGNLLKLSRLAIIDLEEEVDRLQKEKNKIG